MNTSHALHDLKNIPANALWFFEILLGVLGLLCLHAFIKYVIKTMRQKALSHKADWKQNLDSIFLLPVKVLLVTLGAYYVISLLGHRFGFVSFVAALKPFRSAIAVICLSWICLRWKKEVLHHSSQGHLKVTAPGMIYAFNKILSIFICVLALLIILQIFELDIIPLLAFGGIGAAAVGFAAKDVISNFFGGLMLSITRPFTVGDLIILPEHNDMEGHVEEVGWYLTSIRDKDKRPVYLPNAIFSNALVINSSRMSHRRIYETLGVRYMDFDKLKSVTEAIKDFLNSHPSVDTHISPLVFFNAFKDSSLAIYLDVYTLTTRWEDYLAAREEILGKIYEILDQQGVKMPFPTMTLELPEGRKP